MKSENQENGLHEPDLELKTEVTNEQVEAGHETAPGHINHKKMYDLLVDDQNDFLGILTYSVYKRQKREEVHRFFERHKRYPTNLELSSFFDLAQSPMQRNHYAQQAVELINAFIQEVLDEQVDEIDKSYEEKFKERCERFTPSFWFGVWQSVVGSLVFLLALGIIVQISWGSRHGPQGAFERAFNVKIVPHTESAVSPPE